MCYYTSWAVKRPGAGRFEVESIDPFLCTHVIYAFAGMDDFRLAPGHPSDMGDGFKEGTYTRLMKLKEKNPNLKVSGGGPITPLQRMNCYENHSQRY